MTRVNISHIFTQSTSLGIPAITTVINDISPFVRYSQYIYNINILTNWVGFVKSKDMKVNAKEMLERLQRPKDRGPKSVYVSDKVWRDFEKACGKIPVSNVVEDLMRQFIVSAKNRR
jgi:hypothetical protein